MIFKVEGNGVASEKSRSFYKKVKEGFQNLPFIYPSRKFVYIDASKSIDQVKNDVLEAINREFKL